MDYSRGEIDRGNVALNSTLEKGSGNKRGFLDVFKIKKKRNLSDSLYNKRGDKIADRVSKTGKVLGLTGLGGVVGGAAMNTGKLYNYMTTTMPAAENSLKFTTGGGLISTGSVLPASTSTLAAPLYSAAYGVAASPAALVGAGVLGAGALLAGGAYAYKKLKQRHDRKKRERLEAQRNLYVKKHSFFKADYTKDSLYKSKINPFSNNTYDGKKLTNGYLKFIPGAYDDRYNSDTYKILNNGVDDRSWKVRNSNKLGLAKTFGSAVLTGVGTAGAIMAAPVAAIPVFAVGTGLTVKSALKKLKDKDMRAQQLQMKIIDAKERLKKQSHWGDNIVGYSKGDMKNLPTYKGHQLSPGSPFGEIESNRSYELLTDKPFSKKKQLRGSLTMLGALPVGLATKASLINPMVGVPITIGLAGASEISQTRKDRDVQIEAIKLANKLKGRRDSIYSRTKRFSMDPRLSGALLYGAGGALGGGYRRTSNR